MKKIELFIPIFLVIIFLFLPTGSDAAFLNTPTTTQLSGPTTIEIGKPTTYSTITNSDTLVSAGFVDYFNISNSLNYDVGNGEITTVTSPRIVIQNINLVSNIGFMIRIAPTTTISSKVSWTLSDGVNILLQGEITTSELTEMVNNRLLLISFSSIQTLKFSNIQSIDLISSKSYVLSLNKPINFFSTTTSNPNIKLLDNTIDTLKSPRIQILQGNKLTRSPINFIGASTYTFTPLYRNSMRLLTYFGETTSDYLGSFDIMNIEITDSNPPVIMVEDVQSVFGTSSLFRAVVTANQIPIMNQLVKFYIDFQDYKLLIGSINSDVDGIAEISYTFLDLAIKEGQYKIIVEAFNSGKKGVGYSILNLTKQNTVYRGVSATATFSDNGVNKSNLMIQGYLETINYNPISSISIEVVNRTHKLGVVTTNSLGYFQFTNVVNLSPGTYNSWIILRHTGLDYYNIPDKLVDVLVLKGNPTIQVTDINTDYISQPIIVNASIKDNNGNLIPSNVSIEYFDGNSWIEEVSLTTNSGLISVALPQKSANLYNYRILSRENQYYSYSTQLFYVSIGKSNARITRGGLSSYVEVEFKSTADFSVKLTNSNGLPISNANMMMEIPYPLTMTKWYTTNTTTNSTGWANFKWIPDDEFSSAINIFHYVRFYGSHQNYTVLIHSSLLLQFAITPTTLQSELAVIAGNLTPTIDSTTTFEIRMKDRFGSKMIEGKQISVLIDGITYNLITNFNGIVTLTHKFTIAGLGKIQIIYTNDPYDSYTGYNHTYDITIEKGSYVLTSNPYYTNQGEFFAFTTRVKNHENTYKGNVMVSLWILSNTWVNIGNSVTNNSGYATISTQITLGIGLYQYQWRINPTSSYNESTVTNNIEIISILTQITITSQNSYNYGETSISTRTIQVQLRSKLGIPIANKLILITLANYTWNLNTDNYGMVSVIAPQFLLPNTYSISVTFSGDSVFNGITKIKNISIIGTSTHINWINNPVNTYYGDILTLEFMVLDAYNNPIAGMNIIIELNQVKINLISNSTGHIRYSIELRDANDLVTITITASAMNGYEGNTSTYTITNQKRILSSWINYQVNNLTYYNQDVIIEIYGFYRYDYQNFPLKVDIYLYNILTGNFAHFNSYYTLNDGHLSLLLNFPRYNITTDYLVKVLISHPDFIESNYTLLIDIIQSPYDYTTNFIPSNYGGTIPIEFTVNYQGIFISDLKIQISGSSFSNIQYTDVNGYVQFLFIPQSAGSFLLTYTISDINGNYETISGSMIVDVGKADISISTELNDTTGQLFISAMISSSLDISTFNLPLKLYVFNYNTNSWVYLSTVTTNTGLYNFIINPVADALYQLRFDGNLYFKPTSLNQAVYMQNIDIQSNSLNGTADTPIYISDQILIGNGSLNYLISIEIWNTFSNTWMNMGNYTTQEGFIVEPIGMTLSPGNYLLRIVFPMQSFYYTNTLTIDLTINRGDVSVIFPSSEYFIHISTNIHIQLINDYSALNDIYIELFIFKNGIWTLIGSGYTDSNGHAYLIVMFDTLGNFNVKIQTSQTSSLNSVLYQTEIHVRQETLIIINCIPSCTFIYSDSLIIELRLLDKLTNLPLIGATIELRLDSFSILLFGTTNSSGYVTFDLSDEIRQKFTAIMNVYEYELTAYYQATDNFGNASINQIITILPAEVDIQFTFLNYGPTHNISYILNVFNYEFDNLYGQDYYIEWELLVYGMSYPNYYGTISYLTPDTIFVLNYYLQGNYILKFSFFDSMYRYNSSTVSHLLNFPIIQQIQLINEIEGSSFEFEFLQSGYIEFQLLTQYLEENIYLQGINYSIAICGSECTSFFSYTDNLGIIRFYIDLPPGTYSIQIVIYASGYLSNDFYFDYDLNIIPGNHPFDFSVENSNITLPIGFSLTDVFNDTSTYLISVYQNNLLIYTNSTSYDLLDSLIANYTSSIEVGTYLINITRINPNLIPYSVETEFSILPMHMNIYAEYEQIVGTNNITIFITPEYELNLTYYFVIYHQCGNEIFTYEFDSMNYTLILCNSSNTITIQLKGAYFGEALLSITIQDNLSSNNQDELNLVQHISSTGLFIIGASIFALTIKFRGNKGNFKK